MGRTESETEELPGTGLQTTNEERGVDAKWEFFH
jgi:hypothetical protein